MKSFATWRLVNITVVQIESCYYIARMIHMVVLTRRLYTTLTFRWPCVCCVCEKGEINTIADDHCSSGITSNVLSINGNIQKFFLWQIWLFGINKFKPLYILGSIRENTHIYISFITDNGERSRNLPKYNNTNINESNSFLNIWTIVGGK